MLVVNRTSPSSNSASTPPAANQSRASNSYIGHESNVLEALNSRDRELRLAQLHILSGSTYPLYMEAVASIILKDRDRGVREAAVKVFEGKDCDRGVAILNYGMYSKDPLTRSLCARGAGASHTALGQYGLVGGIERERDIKVAAEMVRALRDSFRVRPTIFAVELAGRLMVRERSNDVQMNAAAALSQCTISRSYEELTQALLRLSAPLPRVISRPTPAGSVAHSLNSALKMRFDLKAVDRLLGVMGGSETPYYTKFYVAQSFEGVTDEVVQSALEYLTKDRNPFVAQQALRSLNGLYAAQLPACTAA